MGDVAFVVRFIRAGYIDVAVFSGLLIDHDFCIFTVTADGTGMVRIVGMSSFAGVMLRIVTIHTIMPVMSAAPGPDSGRSCKVTVLGLGVILCKVFCPGIMFHADPILAVAAFKVGVILAANHAPIAVITDAFALRAMLAALFANVRTVGADTAIRADLHTSVAQIAVFTHLTCAGAAHLAAFFADHDLFVAGFTALTVDAFPDGTFDAEFMRGADLHTAQTGVAFGAIIAVDVTVTFIAVGAMHTFCTGAVGTDDHTGFSTAVLTDGDTFGAQHAFFAPSLDFEIAAAALGAVAFAFGGALHTKNTMAQICGTALANLHTIIAFSAFFTPGTGCKVTRITVRAVLSLVYGTLHADGVTHLFLRTALTDITAGAVDAQAALNAHIATLIARVTLAAIGCAVRLFATLGTPCCMAFDFDHRQHADHHHNHQKCA